ncbi:hypothetical protein GPL15_09220 [Clostridium sp. MCC353]|uniref:zf-HC2 domain-containing protein n=1 Tax=Clostridium sp. MCC353 TaxID=2592646 RepID=UPI001C01D0B1|nr:zf-HC2 domain-containing protein [Clostridium sp. MCC353]MBT9776680.1 hypothetical protein [Clostridium sp. MCC353]
MSRKMDCDIIQDLLPLYAERLASEASCRMVREHLEECEECRNLLAELETPVQGMSEEEKEEIDFLKKIRKRHKRLFRATAGLTVILLAAVLSAAVKFYVIGNPVDPNSVTYECVYDPETKELTVRGTINYRMTEFSGIRVKESSIYGNTLDVKVLGADRFSYDKNYNTNFTETIKIPDDGECWRVDLVGPGYTRRSLWDGFRFEDMTPEEMEEFLSPETRVTSDQVKMITADMTSADVQELLGTTTGTYQDGSLNYTLTYIVDEDYLIELVFDTSNPELPCGKTGEEILEGKRKREPLEYRIEGDRLITFPGEQG